MLLNNDSLRNSSSELKLLSLEYAIAFACSEMSKEVEKYKFENFFKNNTLSSIHIVAYPFYIATSNGHSESLFNLFGVFKPTKLLGITSMEFVDIILKDDNHGIFLNFGVNYATLKRGKTYKNWNELLNDILNFEVTINDDKIKFKEILINKDTSDENELYKGIESGVKTLLSQSGNMFFNMNKYGFKAHSVLYNCYRKAIKEENQIIKYEDLREEKKHIPFYSLEFS